MALSVESVTCGYRSKAILRDVSLHAPTGSVLCLLGPNGVGKTTLFKTILGLIPALVGTIRVDNVPTSQMSRRELAQRIGYVPQSGGESFGYRVRDVVLLGRTAWMGLRGSPSAADRVVADRCMAELGIEYLADTSYLELSGGQRQMVLIARSLAQEPAILMMDEPTANLDLGNEARVLRTIKSLSSGGMTVVFTSHRPDHAYACAASAALIQPDGTYRTGPVADILTAESMKSAYGVDVHVATTTTPSHGDVTHCFPLL